jgi:hypothetical protein
VGCPTVVRTVQHSRSEQSLRPNIYARLGGMSYTRASFYHGRSRPRWYNMLIARQFRRYVDHYEQTPQIGGLDTKGSSDARVTNVTDSGTSQSVPLKRPDATAYPNFGVRRTDDLVGAQLHH